MLYSPLVGLVFPALFIICWARLCLSFMSNCNGGIICWKYQFIHL